MTSDDDTSQYVRMGIAVLLPGMEHTIKVLQHQVDEMRARLAELGQGQVKRRGRPKTVLPVVKRRGRGPGRKNNPAPAPAAKTAGGGWPADPEERKAEMARRLAVRKANAKAKAA